MLNVETETIFDAADNKNKLCSVCVTARNGRTRPFRHSESVEIRSQTHIHTRLARIGKKWVNRQMETINPTAPKNTQSKEKNTKQSDRERRGPRGVMKLERRKIKFQNSCVSWFNDEFILMVHGWKTREAAKHTMSARARARSRAHPNYAYLFRVFCCCCFLLCKKIKGAETHNEQQTANSTSKTLHTIKACSRNSFLSFSQRESLCFIFLTFVYFLWNVRCACLCVCARERMSLVFTLLNR